MSKPNIEHRFGHNERGGGNCHQVDDYSLPQASASTSHPPHDLANACVTESAFSLEWGQSKSADGSNQLPRISKGLPSSNDPYLECANSLLPKGETFPISFLQMRFRIGYFRALKLHGAVIKRRAK
ncbi:hypothetical protein [Comamonas jiangduensis]|jgi:hypothetical protein|uniref:hypothetical protein n=1 Tax=Comamonas jiangduensis TaxID=1194168 RepID=UPI003BF8968B